MNRLWIKTNINYAENGKSKRILQKEAYFFSKNRW